MRIRFTGPLLVVWMLLGVCIFPAPVRATPTSAPARLVTAIDPTAQPQGSSPSNFTRVGTLMFFTARLPTGNNGLWRSDGTPAGTWLVSDTVPTHLVSLGTTLFFSSGDTLWRSDGTAEGTIAITSVPNTSITVLVTLGDKLVFVCERAGQPGQLWQSDGTAAGTTRVADLPASVAPPNWPYAAPALITRLAIAGSTLFFVVNDGTANVGLWRSDGTPQGTALVTPLTAGATVRALTAVNAAVFFAISTPNADSLWRSDGTAQGTQVVYTSSGAFPELVRHLVNVNGTLFFSTRSEDDFGATSWLWRSDGTSGGTVRIKKFAEDSWSVAVVNGTLYFNANDGIWKSDGTEAGTVLVTKTNGVQLTSVGGMLFFVSGVTQQTAQLWRSDGSAAGTTLLHTFVRSAPASHITLPITTMLNDGGSILFFAADDAGSGAEPWTSDGTPGGTRQLANLLPDVTTGRPIQLTPFNDALVFGVRYPLAMAYDSDGLLVAVGPSPNDELWTSDGTPSGTRRFTKITIPDYFSSLKQMVAVQQHLFLTVDGYLLNGHESSTSELWRSDGTAEGTRHIDQLNISSLEAQHIGSANNALFVGGSSFLWRTNDLSATPLTFDALHVFACTPAYSGCISHLGQFTSVATKLFFVLNDGTHPALWSSDGTPDGTQQLNVFAPTTCSPQERSVYTCQATPYDLRAVNGQLYFIANDGSGTALWTSDGTPAGTVRANLPLPSGALPHHLTAVPNSTTLLFTTDTPDRGAELWMSDGTAAGTRLVQDINPGAASANPDQLTVVGTTLFFTADDGIHGVSLWSVPFAPQADAARFVTPRDTPVQDTLPGRALPDTPLTYRISTPPAHGTATLVDGATGTFRYTPASDFRGTDSFQFVVNNSAPATVTISVGDYHSFMPLVVR